MTNEDLIKHALSKLSGIDERLGLYCSHASTTKGVTLKTSTGAFFFPVAFISQLFYQPESVTIEKLNRELNLQEQF